MEKLKKIILTGGTYAGKSTLLECLKNKNYQVLPETGAIIIAELNEQFGIDGQRQWRRENPKKFYTLIMDRQRELESTVNMLNDNVLFLDRAVPDYIAFMKLVGIQIDEHLWHLARSSTYDVVLVCKMLEPFDERVASGRSLSKKESQKLEVLTREVYEELGYQTYILEAVALEQRIQKILEFIV